MVKNSGRFLVGDEKELVRDGALGSLGRPVNRRGLAGIGHGDGNCRGAAAVETQHSGTAQLQQALRGLVERRADGVSADSAVYGVEYQSSVGLLPDSGSGAFGSLRRVDHFSVFGQQIERPHSLLYGVPLLIGRRDGKRNRRTNREIDKCLLPVFVGFAID